MGTGFRTATSGGAAAPPYTNGPYTFSEEITFEGAVTVEGTFTFGDVAADELTITGFITTADAKTGKFLETGTYQSTASGGITLSATNFRPTAFLHDDAGAALGAGDYRAVLSRVLLTLDQPNAVTLNAMRGQVKLNDGIDISSASSVVAANQGYLEFAGTGARSVSGHVACVRAALEEGASGTTTIAASSFLAGFEATLNSTRSHTVTGEMAAFMCNISGGTSVWPVGLLVVASSCTTGIEVQAATTGINVSGACTDGLIIAGACSDNGIEISGACTTGLAVTGVTTEAIDITGNATTAINIDTGAFTSGLTMSAAFSGIALSVTNSALTAGDSYSGLRSVVTAAAATNAYGMSGYFDATITGTTAGHCYGLGSWINTATTPVLSSGHIIVPLEVGVYTGEAQSNARVVLCQLQAVLNGAPDSLHVFRINTTQTTDAVFAAANAGSIGFAASATTNSTKNGDIPIADVVGTGVVWVRTYDAAA